MCINTFQPNDRVSQLTRACRGTFCFIHQRRDSRATIGAQKATVAVASEHFRRRHELGLLNDTDALLARHELHTQLPIGPNQEIEFACVPADILHIMNKLSLFMWRRVRLSPNGHCDIMKFK